MTDFTESVGSDAAVIAELADEARARDVLSLVDGHLIGVLRTKDQVLEQIDLEQYEAAPYRKTGAVTLRDAQSLIAYVKRHLDQVGTTLWSDVDQARIVAVLDDHETTSNAGWGQHRATLQLRETDEWRLWRSLDGKLVDQQTFAEHIESGASNVVTPDAATMLEIAQSFHAKKGVNFTSDRRLSGEVQFGYEETVTARAGQRGSIEVPALFELSLAPFDGTAEQVVTARLRFRLSDGHLSLGYRLIRPDVVRRVALTEVTDAVATGTGLPVMSGTPRA